MTVSLFDASRNKQEFVGSRFVSGKNTGKDKLTRYSVLNSFKGSGPKINSCVCGLKTSFLS